MKKLFLPSLLAVVASPLASGSVITFETTPSGGTPVDNSIVAPYVVGGTTVSFGWDTNLDFVANRPMFYELYGDADPVSAYAGDGDTSGLGDDFFMRLPNDSTLTFLTSGTRFLVTYAGLLPSGASGSVWDIDPGEQFSVQAYDSSGLLLAAQDLSPTSANNAPTNFTFTGLGEIKYITATSSTSSPFGFDNFDATLDTTSAIPETGSSALIAALGCAGMFLRQRNDRRVRKA